MSARFQRLVGFRPLPWRVEIEGVKALTCAVVDANGAVVCVCYGEDGGSDEARAIATAINYAGPRICAHCGKEATCFGSYEDGTSPGYACDDCCGHGCEDGWCEQLSDEEG